MKNASHKVFEWAAVVTWLAVVGWISLYGLLYFLNVIYVQKKSLERLPDFPHLALAGDER